MRKTLALEQREEALTVSHELKVLAEMASLPTQVRPRLTNPHPNPNPNPYPYPNPNPNPNLNPNPNPRRRRGEPFREDAAPAHGAARGARRKRGDVTSDVGRLVPGSR